MDLAAENNDRCGAVADLKMVTERKEEKGKIKHSQEAAVVCIHGPLHPARARARSSTWLPDATHQPDERAGPE